MTVCFTIPGKPFAKQRPRMTRSGVAFTPKETVSFERTVGQIGLQHFSEPLLGPVSVRIEAVFEIPKSWSRKKSAEAHGAPHIQRPDLDNCMKAILDGLNRIAFADDSQVAEMVLRKRWGDVAGTTVWISPVGGELFT